MRVFLSVIVFSLGAVHLAFPVLAETSSGPDPRRTEVAAPAPWQAAVVKLRVPVSRLVAGRRVHSIEDCTGTVVDTVPRRILSAWHCFDGYDDLTRAPTFRVGNRWHTARLLTAGGSMASDWAVLTADQDAIDQLPALSMLSRQDAIALPLGEAITIAGFSGDAGLGADGEVLTFDDSCRIDDQDQHWLYSRCTAYKGSSGGPVLVNSHENPKVAGVISGRNEQGLVLFVPIHRANLGTAR